MCQRCDELITKLRFVRVSSSDDHKLPPASDVACSSCKVFVLTLCVIDLIYRNQEIALRRGKQIRHRCSTTTKNLYCVREATVCFPPSKEGISLHVGNAKCIIASFELNSELKSASSKTDSEESVIQVAKLWNTPMKRNYRQMSWPPKCNCLPGHVRFLLLICGKPTKCFLEDVKLEADCS